MSQHDFDIANQTASNARVDINLALKALGSLSSGVTAPTTTYANMMWYDTTNSILKMRSEADDAWITLGTLDQGSNTFELPPSPVFTGTPVAPTATPGTNTTQIATTAYTKAEISSQAGAIPTGSSGIGQWVTISSASGAALVLPAGGTWAWFGQRFFNGGQQGWSVGVNAGGTTVMGAVGGQYHNGLGWRIT